MFTEGFFPNSITIVSIYPPHPVKWAKSRLIGILYLKRSWWWRASILGGGVDPSYSFSMRFFHGLETHDLVCPNQHGNHGNMGWSVGQEFRILVNQKRLYLLLMVQKSGDHQLRLVFSDYLQGFYTSQVVQDFFHQQYEDALDWKMYISGQTIATSHDLTPKGS